MEKTKKLTIMALTCILMLLAMSSTVNAIDEYDWSSYGTDEAAGIAFLGIGIMMCVIYLVIFIVWILAVVWVYKDAKKRGGNEALWAILVFFTGLIGLIIWLVIRPPIGGKQQGLGGSSEPDRRCPNCGRPIPMDAKVCPYCGKNFEQH